MTRLSVILCVGLALFTPSLQVLAVANALTPTRITLKNGLTVLTIEQPQLPLMAARLLIRTGSTEDPVGKEGLTALVSMLLKKGAGSRDATDIADRLDFCGAELAVDYSQESTVLSGSALSRDSETLLELMADSVIRPAFADDEIDRERENLLAAIAQTRENADYLAGAFFNRFLYGTHPYSRPELGLTASVARLTREDILAFHQTYYVPNNAVLIIAADLPQAALMKTIKHLFQNWRRHSLPTRSFAAPPDVATRSLSIIDKPDLSQTHVRIGTIGIPRHHPDYLPLMVANTILGGGGFSSRLVDRIRVDRGLTYGIGSQFTQRRDRGAFVVSTFTKTETTGELVEAVIEELRRFRASGVSISEVQSARQYLNGSFPMTVEGPRALVSQLANMEQFGLPPDYLQTYQSRLQAVTPDVVNRVIHQYFTDKALLCVLLGNADQIVPQVEKLGPVRRQPFDLN